MSSWVKAGGHKDRLEGRLGGHRESSSLVQEPQVHMAGAGTRLRSRVPHDPNSRGGEQGAWMPPLSYSQAREIPSGYCSGGPALPGGLGCEASAQASSVGRSGDGPPPSELRWLTSHEWETGCSCPPRQRFGRIPSGAGYVRLNVARGGLLGVAAGGQQLCQPEGGTPQPRSSLPWLVFCKDQAV